MVVNSSEVPLIYRIVKSGSMASADIHLARAKYGGVYLISGRMKKKKCTNGTSYLFSILEGVSSSLSIRMIISFPISQCLCSTPPFIIGVGG